ncbi:oxidoreductase [Lithospermum erythrorhizon]|uniref:Oxidoreductase n=1 Tax=Lithospermum erythrorhizon TaxID=34254 RepID=A0AAV3S235_LITER
MEALCSFAASSSFSRIPKSSFSTHYDYCIKLHYSNGCSTTRLSMVVPCMSGKKSHSPSCSSTFLYEKFIEFALEETKCYTPLLPSPLQTKFSTLLAMDGNTELEMSSFESTKLRLWRNLSIKGKKNEGGVQVMDFAVFPKPEFDLPIFCANFFSVADINIVVLDLNPLYNVINEKGYKEKYYIGLIHLAAKYAELLPWGGKLTAESLQFFSPIVIWTKFSSCPEKYDALFSAFKDYYKAFLELMHQAEEETDVSRIRRNRAAQHKYLTWRTEKDPGHGMLSRLIGESMAKEVISGFLFNGVLDLGSATFNEYFPEYKCEDGSISVKRSMIGKSYEKRPWNANGEFIGDNRDNTS